jgi:hypothetical protein
MVRCMEARKMTRKDFKLIAETIRLLPSFELGTELARGPQAEIVRFAVICHRFAEALATTNPRFNKDRFIAACNGKECRNAD